MQGKPRREGAGEALRKGTGEHPEKGVQGKAMRKGTGEAQEEWMQGFALKDGGLTFKAGPRRGKGKSLDFRW